MTPFQLRLDPKTRLADLARDLITGFETVLRYNQQPVPWGREQQRSLLRQIRRILQKNVQAFSACGKEARCHVFALACQTSDGSPHAALSPEQKVLLLKEDVATLTLELEANVFDRFLPNAPDTRWLRIRSELQTVIEETLWPALYINPYCSDCSLCIDQANISPWRF